MSPRVCELCGCTYEPTGTRQKACVACRPRFKLECVRRWREANPERNRENLRRWQAANRESRLAYQRWYHRAVRSVKP